MSKELQQKYEKETRLATKRELHLLANTINGRHRNASQDKRRLGAWSEEQLKNSLDRR
jgi:hypothetical protein